MQFSKSLAFSIIGTVFIIFGLYLFEKNLLISIISIIAGILIICFSDDGTDGKSYTYINVFGNLKGITKEEPHAKKDRPFNPWDEVSDDKK